MKQLKMYKDYLELKWDYYFMIKSRHKYNIFYQQLIQNYGIYKKFCNDLKKIIRNSDGRTNKIL